MAAREKKVRMLRCVVSGREFEYCGYGRPPKYHPDVKAQIVKEQRQRARDNQARKRISKAA